MLYRQIIQLKNKLYNSEIVKSVKLKTPVLSIGNLTTGGTGKTPFIIYLCESLLKKRGPDFKIALVVKSYKAKTKSAVLVDLNQFSTLSQAVQFYGDEACMLKLRLPYVDVWSGPVKWKTAFEAEKKSLPSIILVDDGFSHRKLHRDLDLVLIDYSRSKNHYRLLPCGHMREPWGALLRSDIVLRTKLKNSSEDMKSYLDQKISKNTKNATMTTNSTLVGPPDLHRPLHFVSAVGNPEKIMSELKYLGYIVDQKSIYTDHYPFPESEQIKINQKNKKENQIVMTEKDFVKLTYEPLKLNTFILGLEVSLSSEEEIKLYEKISQIL